MNGYESHLAYLPEWARDTEPMVSHGSWEIDPTVEPTKQLVAVEVSGGILSAYVSKYEERLIYTYRREHLESWSRPGHFKVETTSDWVSGAFTETLTFRNVYVDREMWGIKTWERKDCGL